MSKKRIIQISFEKNQSNSQQLAYSNENWCEKSRFMHSSAWVKQNYTWIIHESIVRNGQITIQMEIRNFFFIKSFGNSTKNEEKKNVRAQWN